MKNKKKRVKHKTQSNFDAKNNAPIMDFEPNMCSIIPAIVNTY